MIAPKGVVPSWLAVTATMALTVACVCSLAPADPAENAERAGDATRQKTPKPVQFVRRHLAERVHVRPETITIEKVEPVTWPDGCLGVPAPELCAPGEVPGFRVVLGADGKRYVFHTDRKEGFRFAGLERTPTNDEP